MQWIDKSPGTALKNEVDKYCVNERTMRMNASEVRKVVCDKVVEIHLPAAACHASVKNFQLAMVLFGLAIDIKDFRRRERSELCWCRMMVRSRRSSTCQTSGIRFEQVLW
jgi:hypothetical protein